uniref:anthocyanidin 3-O-glucosyltransferase n=1 Tax=Viola tricolor TaxID=214053 RepID=A0AA51VI44_9ROSI|nr:C-rhamnosyltransferase [Viola tricolor]
MEYSGNPNNHSPHVAILAGAGIGHLTPILRLAASLLKRNCLVTLITGHPCVSDAESKLISAFLSAFPQARKEQFHIVPVDPPVEGCDPFWLQWEATRRSLQVLPSLLHSLSPPLSALVTDVTLLTPVLEFTATLKNLPKYILFVSCARMFSLLASYHTFFSTTHHLPDDDYFSKAELLETPFPGVGPFLKSSIPAALQEATNLFVSIFKEDGKRVSSFDGVFINTFDRLEPELVGNGAKLFDGRVMPPLITVRLSPCDFERGAGASKLGWLDDQAPGSVVYVSFGSRIAIKKERIREIGEGLVRCGYPFLWVVKDKIVDKEDTALLEDVIGDELMEKVKSKGLVVKEWVDQGEILGHKAVGGFVNHSGWNSVTEAAWCGMRVLAWPADADQGLNAEAVEKSGLGIWAKDWGCLAGPNSDKMVTGEEIGTKIQEMMGNDLLRLQAQQIRDEARNAFGDGGTCENALKELIEKWKINQ